MGYAAEGPRFKGTGFMVDDLWSRVEGSGVEEWVYLFSAETFDPLA